MSSGIAMESLSPAPGPETPAAEAWPGRRMRILILSINYWPEVTGIGAFTTYRAEHLAAAGHDVEVCTTFPYYPAWKVAADYSGKLAMTESRNGVRIRRGFAYVPQPGHVVRAHCARSKLHLLGRRREPCSGSAPTYCWWFRHRWGWRCPRSY